MMAFPGHVVEGGLRYFKKWVGIAILIGIVSGLGAAAFNYLVHHVTELMLGHIVGYYPPKPGGTGAKYIVPEDRLLLLLLPLVGGLLSGLIVYTFAPEAEGHGTDAAIEAFHYREGLIRQRVPLIKLLASAITIGSGGSAGKEGPVAQIGGGFGSFLAQVLKLSPKDRRIALAVGVGSGIGAIFKAPFGGAIFASEVLYLVDFEPEVIPPAFIASFVGYIVNGYLTGWGHVFAAPTIESISYKLYEPLTLAFFALLGIINGLFGIVYVKAFYGVRDLFKGLRKVPNHLKPAIGGLLTGLIGLLFPYALETSYGWLQMAINGEFEKMPLYVLMLMPLLKILATSFSIGSGGSGGVFAPALVIGGFLGATVWHLAKDAFPTYDVPAAPFVVIGMMSFFGGVGKVPIATLLMVSEMTGEYEVFAPSLLAITLSYIITGRHTIYEKQLLSRIESPAHEWSKVGLVVSLYERLKRSLPNILEETKAKDIMVRPSTALNRKMRVNEVINIVKAYPYRVYPVVDDDNRFVGFIRLEEIPYLSKKAMNIEVAYLPIHKGVTVHPNDKLKDVISLMVENEVDKVFVVDEDGRLVGIITAKEVLRYVMTIRGRST